MLKIVVFKNNEVLVKWKYKLVNNETKNIVCNKNEKQKLYVWQLHYNKTPTIYTF